MELHIKKEFAELLPPQTAEERKLLEADLKENGIEDPIKYNLNGEILDGMTRWEIAQKYKLDYETHLIQLSDPDECVWYILTNQLARRNLNQDTKAAMLAKLYAIKRHSIGRPKKLCQHDTVSEDGQDESETDGAKEVANLTDVSRSTVFRATAKEQRKQALLEQLPSEIAKLYQAGEKWNESQAESLLASPHLGEIARAIRVGNARTIKEAIKQITGSEKLAKPPKPLPRDDEPSQAPTDDDAGPEERMKAATLEINRHCSALKEWLEAFDALAGSNPYVANQRESVHAKVKSILDAMRAAKGKKVCPKCDGQGCTVCHEMGWVDKLTNDQLD